jgi:AraC-like DNA-binding protein
MRFYFLTFFIIGSHLAIGQNHLLDSLYATLKNHPQEDTVRVNIIIAICWEEYTFRPEKNKALAEEALKISKGINFAKGIGTANGAIALYYWATGDYEKATHYAYNMLRIHEGIPYPHGVGQSYQLLAHIHQLEGDLKKTEVFYNKALTIYKRENLKKDIGFCYSMMGGFYLELGKLDIASDLFHKSLEVKKEINDVDGMSATYGALAQLHTLKKEYSKALEYFEKSLEMVAKLNNQFRMSVIQAGMGEMYISIGNYDKAKFHLVKSIDLAKGLHHKKMLEKLYRKLALLEKKRGRFDEALTYFALAITYKDSIYTEDKTKKIAEIETRYETEKKDQLIQLLERDKRIQSLWRNIFITALVLVSLLSLVIYFLQRYRERKNRKILNLQIDSLISQQKELSVKYKDVITSGDEKSLISHDQRLLRKAIALVEKKMSDPLFSVEKMAEEIGMSRTNMHRKIKAITGFPPSELIRSIRLRKAALLLLNETDSISQISFNVGFEDHSYFSKAFKKQFGVSPSEYVQSSAQSTD